MCFDMPLLVARTQELHKQNFDPVNVQAAADAATISSWSNAACAASKPA